MKKLASLVLALLSVCSLLTLAACDVSDITELDFKNFDITKKNFGLVSDSDAAVSSTDAPVVSLSDFVVAEFEGVRYEEWQVVDKTEYKAKIAEPKLLEMAGLITELDAMEQRLGALSDAKTIAADVSFSRTLNSLRAWRYGAECYPSQEVPQKSEEQHKALTELGRLAADYAARLPAMIANKDSSAIGDYKNRLIDSVLAAQ